MEHRRTRTHAHTHAHTHARSHAHTHARARAGARVHAELKRTRKKRLCWFEKTKVLKTSFEGRERIKDCDGERKGENTL